jgi:hypothetical protein
LIFVNRAEDEMGTFFCYFSFILLFPKARLKYSGGTHSMPSNQQSLRLLLRRCADDRPVRSLQKVQVSWDCHFASVIGVLVNVLDLHILSSWNQEISWVGGTLTMTNFMCSGVG